MTQEIKTESFLLNQLVLESLKAILKFSGEDNCEIMLLYFYQVEVRPYKNNGN